MNSTKDLLMGSKYWVLNKKLVEVLDLECAFVLVNLVEAENMMADEEGWFYQTSGTFKKITGLSGYIQTKAIKKLIKLGILMQVNKGLPQKRFFKISYRAIEVIVFKKLEDYNPKNYETKLPKTLNNKESINKESTNKETHVRLEKEFEIFWKLYDKKVDKKGCLEKWKKLDDKTREDIMEFVPKYIEVKERKYRRDPIRFFSKEVWKDEIYDENIGQNGKGFEKPQGKVIIGTDRYGKLIYE